MEDVGFLGFVPPFLAIALALLTKDVIFSVFMGIVSGALILAGGNPLTAFIHLTDLLADRVADSWNIRIFLFCALLGGLVGLLARSGSVQAFGRWAARFIRGRRSAQLFTLLFGLLIFIDDYFNSLAVGSVMRPITDERQVSRAKLAFILDSTAAPICIVAPVSSWVVTVISQIRASGGFEQLGVGEMSFFIMLIPYNLYALLALAMVFMVAWADRDFGPMAASERRAARGQLFDEELYGEAPGCMDPHEEVRGAAWFDMALPMLVLIFACVAAFPLSSHLELETGRTLGLLDAFRQADASKALFYGIIFALSVSYCYFLARRILTIKLASEAILDGVKSMVPALGILILAWTIGHIISKPVSGGGLGLPLFIDTVLRGSGFPLWMLPVCVFLLSGVIAFSTGTSWGTFGIMIPITLPTAVSLATSQNLGPDGVLHCALVSVGAVLSGAVFGDHTSPISDTTILSSAGAGCPHLEHVATQFPYAFFSAICAGAGIVAGGYSLNPWIALLVAAGLFFPGFFYLTARSARKVAKL